MSPIAPIASIRVAGIRPVMQSPVADPIDTGIDVEAVTEVTYTPTSDALDEARSSKLDASTDPGMNAFTRAAISAPSVTLGTLGDVQHVGPPRGNAQVSTDFDATPAEAHEAARQAFTSPFERAMAIYAS